MTLFILCFIVWWRGRCATPRTAYIMLSFISIVFILGSIGNATAMRMLQLTYVDDRKYPGGPAAFEALYGSTPVNVAGTAAYALIAWFTDGLLVSCMFYLRELN